MGVINLTTRRATMLDVVEILPSLRREDLAEVEAEGYAPMRKSLEMSLAMSGSQAWTVRRDGKIMAMWGVVEVNLLGGVAVPWALTTTEVDRHPKDFLRETLLSVRRLRSQYALLWNRVDARYTKALRWAKRAGFEVGSPITFKGYTFCLITMRGV